jgi:N-acetylglucosaminyldiphosphoundecaprenol N-acetyl-beta-D-mannosaminyltransferase
MPNRAANTRRTTSVYRIYPNPTQEIPAPNPASPSQPGSGSREAMPRVNIGAVAIDTYSQAALLDEAIDHALHSSSTRQIVTVNAQFYVLAQKHSRFRECLKEADYICADGMPIVWACNTISEEHVPRIAGVDLIEKLCQRGAAHGLRVFFLGGRPEAANTTARILSERYAGLEIAGVSCPEFGFELSAESLQPVLEHIAQARPHILFVGLGAPKQELLIHDHIRQLKVPLAIGIGGGFEILSGILGRAPAWMQDSGLEWAFRLWQEPNRLWKRYLVGNIEFLWFVAKWRFRNGLGGTYTGAQIGGI